MMNHAVKYRATTAVDAEVARAMAPAVPKNYALAFLICSSSHEN